VAYAPLVKTFSERFALGLIGSTGAIAIIMPPSIAMILYATATNTSTAKLFLGGIIPALILMVILSVYLVWISPSNRGQEKFDKRAAIRETIAATPVLLLPVIILGGIYGGIFTPTEAAGVAAVYSFALPFIFFGELRWKDLKASLFDCISVNSQLFIIVAASTVFSQALAMSNVARDLATALSGMSPILFLIVLNLFLLGVGCIFDPGPAILIIAPVVAPIAEKLGIDLIHLGIIITVNLAIGMFTPPYGLNLFVMQGIFKKSLEQVSAGIVPFFILFTICLMIVTFCPSLYMWLPAKF
jgi:C4-dicarboxylate transporter DctM subunit